VVATEITAAVVADSRALTDYARKVIARPHIIVTAGAPAARQIPVCERCGGNIDTPGIAIMRGREILHVRCDGPTIPDAMTARPPRLVESIDGRGHLHAGSALVGDVEYRLDVYRDFQNKVDGQTRVHRGCPIVLSGRDFSGLLGEVLTLELRDGRRTDLVLSQTRPGANYAIGAARPPV
jgi:hypothetical protein